MVAMFSCYVDMKRGVYGRYPIFAVVRLEKIRWSPAEMWAEDPLVEVLRGNGFRVHGLEVIKGRKLLTAVLKLETALEVPNYLNKEEVLKLIHERMREKLWNVFKSLYEEEVEADVDVDEDIEGEWWLEGVGEEWTQEKNEDDDPFENLEYWWKRYHGDED